MVPIHDSDIAEERWAQAEWQHYELWEKIEVKLRRRRNLWIAGAVSVFLLLSSVPIIMDHWPKWMSLKAARKLGDVINEVKNRSGIENQAYRLEFSADRRLSYSIFKVPNCAAPISAGTVEQTGTLLSTTRLDLFTLISASGGKELGIPGLTESFCYDPLTGSSSTSQAESISGFAIIPVKDLADHRQDRISLLIFKGPSAEVSFE